MSKIKELFNNDLKVINVGLDSFAGSLKEQGVSVISVDWKPDLFSSNTKQIVEKIKNSKIYPKIKAANSIAVEKIMNAQPQIVDIGKAIDVIPGMKENLFLHAGPPISWEKMSGPLKGGIIGGLIYEGLASTPEEAEQLAKSGKIKFDSCHNHSSVGPMAGIITPRMPVWILKNNTYNNYAYSTLNEGLGKVLRYGAYSEEVIDRLKWMEEFLAPALKQVLSNHGPIDMSSLITQALQMGDEGHNRNRAGTSLFYREIAPEIISLNIKDKDKIDILNFINTNDHFFLNLTMPTCKCVLDNIQGIEYSTILCIMARNGTEFGIKLSSLPDKWFNGPAQKVDGLLFSNFTEDDANLDIGDSVITETGGIGGFSMASAPAIVQFVGGSAADALNFTQEMYDITVSEHRNYKIPSLDFRGTPTGIDLMKIIDTGILPIINTGIAHKEPGVGMVGAGLVHPPSNCFEDAIKAFYEKYKTQI